MNDRRLSGAVVAPIARRPERGSMRRLGALVDQAKRHGVRDDAVLAAIGSVPRDRFVPANLASAAFDDGPLPIGEGQTVSQPAMVAMMAEAARLTGRDRVLEVGTGSGYGAMVLGRIAERVISIERRPRLARAARAALAQFPRCNVEVVVGDGTLGWPDEAPYDAIVVTAAGPTAPPPLLEQLAPTGRLVIPLGSIDQVQKLTRYTRRARSAAGQGRAGQRAEYKVETIAEVRFVPLIGEHGHTM